MGKIDPSVDLKLLARDQYTANFTGTTLSIATLLFHLTVVSLGADIESLVQAAISFGTHRHVIEGADFIVTPHDFFGALKEVRPSLSTHPNTDSEGAKVGLTRSSLGYLEARAQLHEVADEVASSTQPNKLLAELIPMNDASAQGEKEYTFPVSCTSSSILLIGEPGAGKRHLCYELYSKFGLVRELKAQDLLVDGYEEACKVVPTFPTLFPTNMFTLFYFVGFEGLLRGRRSFPGAFSRCYRRVGFGLHGPPKQSTVQVYADCLLKRT